MENCLFCKIAAGIIPSTKVYEDEQVYAFRDIAPQAPTHILVIPKEHISGMSGIRRKCRPGGPLPGRGCSGRQGRGSHQRLPHCLQLRR